MQKNAKMQKKTTTTKNKQTVTPLTEAECSFSYYNAYKEPDDWHLFELQPTCIFSMQLSKSGQTIIYYLPYLS